jgi:hypothetical protein
MGKGELEDDAKKALGGEDNKTAKAQPNNMAVAVDPSAAAR